MPCAVPPSPAPPCSASSRHPRRTSRARAASAAAAAAAPARPFSSGPDASQLPALLSQLASLASDAGPAAPARAAQGARALARLVSSVLRDAAAGRPPRSPPALLRALFDDLGATYTKLGQFVASSPTLFPPEYVAELQGCLDEGAPPVPFSAVRALVEAELGQPLGAVFESFEPQPLASASVAQVHAAVLRGSRKEVAVKVQRPGVDSALRADLAFVAGLALVLEFLAPELGRGSLAGVAADVRAAMLDELDFRKEAANAAAFSAYLDSDPVAAACASTPFVYPALSTRRVLTMERLRGSPLTDLASLSQAAARRGVQPEEVLIGALNAWAGSLLACDAFHADVHAGNLLVLRDGRVAFLDFGQVGRVSPQVWAAAASLLAAASTGAWREAAASLVALGATTTGAGAGGGAAMSAADVAAFGDELAALAAAAGAVRAAVVVEAGDAAGAGFGGGGGAAGGRPPPPGGARVGVAVDEAGAAALLAQLLDVASRRGLRLPRAFGLLVKQLLYFDRYARILAPDLDVLADGRVRLGGSQAEAARGAPAPPRRSYA